jgi:hypothetical protein
MSTNILEDLSSITETSNIFIDNFIQNGGDFSTSGSEQLGGFLGRRTSKPLLIIFGLTIMCTLATLCNIYTNKSHCS